MAASSPATRFCNGRAGPRWIGTILRGLPRFRNWCPYWPGECGRRKAGHKIEPVGRATLRERRSRRRHRKRQPSPYQAGHIIGPRNWLPQRRPLHLFADRSLLIMGSTRCHSSCCEPRGRHQPTCKSVYMRVNVAGRADYKIAVMRLQGCVA